MIHRGDVFDIEFPAAGRHPGVVVTREAAIPVLSSVVVILVTTTVRRHPVEVELSAAPEMDLHAGSVVNCDNLETVPKSRFGRFRGRLGPEDLRRLDDALRIALGLD